VKRSRGHREAFLEAAKVQMEQNPTVAEKALWARLKALGGWETQRPILVPMTSIQDRPFILDFFHPDSNLCVEVDGSAHRHRVTRDHRRDNLLRKIGIRTLRFSNNDVLIRIEATLAIIVKATMEE